ncbi:ZYRO0F15752p [Zygosaccharomyces rouxii]|uniref:ZYRO0F15752p n=2 Tax=Zygosaccharomyces rouxii TaxID=4956 RepID=C5DYU1_ZYGRC|nr:uncharacterized protein ZYRO0F15752g [Zygosaccharomyces rouxii]KAH9199708.1 regulatory protein SIR1 [Zygosaccharomyces rouxii]CAQ43418.1 Regulatory protein SIR1 [Zygosaccharomyces rouxii]CAR28952.1 ZYRO0F15752p [Zygosaccharomyces rouxii]
MKEYPVITVPKGQFIVIDGFLVKLGADEKESNELFLRDARNLLTFEGWNILRNSYYPNALIKLKEIRSNFYLTDNQSFLNLMKTKISVIFIKNQGRFYCRRVDSNKSTHEALSIKVGDKSQRIKFIVFDKPTNKLDYSTDELYFQQKQDLEEIKPILSKNAPPMVEVDNENAILNNVIFVSENKLNKLKRYPIRRAHLRKIERQESEKRLATLWELKERLLSICFESCFWQLERLKSKCHRKDLQSKFEDCKDQIRTNLLDINDAYFPLLIREWFATFPRLANINENYGIVDRFVINLPTKCIVDPETIEWSLEEREFLQSKNLMDWNTLKLSKGPIPIRNTVLFEHVNWETKRFLKDFHGHITVSDDSNVSSPDSNSIITRCILINLKGFGIRYLYESVDDKSAFYTPQLPPQSFKPPKDVGDRKHNKLMRNLSFFVSYGGLRTLYIKTFEQFRSMHSKNR